MQSFWYIHVAVSDDYTQQATSDISGPTFHIDARYMVINWKRMPDILAIY